MVFQPAPLLIGLREGLEALLVLGIILGMLDRLGARDRRPLVWTGFGLGVAASVGLGILVDRIAARWFADAGAAWFELVVALAAVGVLTWMVLWMQRHARQMTAGLHAKVAAAVAGRQGYVLAFLGFVTVLREGLEVVLFYGALSRTIRWSELALWGAVGFTASAVIAYAIFRLTVKVDVRRFFAITGILLLFIAAGLLVHTVHALAELDLIPHDTPVWDTSGVLPDDDHWLGGPLHALVGYEDQPTPLQLLLYTGYLVGFGGLYLAGLREGTARRRTGTVAAGVLVLLLAGFAFAGAVPTEDLGRPGHSHGGAFQSVAEDPAIRAAQETLEDTGLRVGVLVRSHGEPTHYNASTYESFKEFIRGIWPYTGLPAELLDVDAGTYYMDEARPWSHDHAMDPALVDAWLEAPEVAAVPVPQPEVLGQVQGMLGEGALWWSPAGPGLGEGDIFEIFGLDAYRTWLKMDNNSPKPVQTEDHFAWLADALRDHFGAQVHAEFAHHIDPHTNPDRNLERAVGRLVEWGPDVIVDMYHSSVRSDAMDTCMMRPHAQMVLHHAGYTGPVVQAGMPGTHRAWAQAVVSYLEQEADHFHDGENVSVWLAQHGARPGSKNPCGDGQEVDQYHRNLQTQFAVAEGAIHAAYGERFTVRHVYGQGAGGPQDGVLSPMEALALDKAGGIVHAVVIPYEFWSDSMDNLVPLREGLGFTPEQSPYYDASYETHITIDGVHIDVWSAHYSVPEKGHAILARIAEAMVEAGQA